nr:hypothetical protein CFP56_56587 [Quercus suber]
MQYASTLRQEQDTDKTKGKTAATPTTTATRPAIARVGRKDQYNDTALPCLRHAFLGVVTQRSARHVNARGSTDDTRETILDRFWSRSGSRDDDAWE